MPRLQRWLSVSLVQNFKRRANETGVATEGYAYKCRKAQIVSTARDCANDGTDSCADRPTLNGFFGLAVLLDRAVVIHADRLSLGGADVLDHSRELTAHTLDVRRCRVAGDVMT